MSRTVDPVSEARASRIVADNGADLLRYFARRHPNDAEDLLSETLAVIWKRRDHLPEDATDARMWSFGIARNVSHRHRRGLRSRLRLHDALMSEAEVADDATDNPSAVAESREREAAVRRALEHLREDDREMILLVHWDGFTLADAAGLLGMNASTARTRYGRAKQRLAVHLEQHRSRSTSTRGDVLAPRRRYGPGVQDA